LRVKKHLKRKDNIYKMSIPIIFGVQDLDFVVIRPDSLYKMDLCRNTINKLCRGVLTDEYINFIYTNFDKGFVCYCNDELQTICAWKLNEQIIKSDGSTTLPSLRILILYGSEEQNKFKVKDYIFKKINEYCMFYNIKCITLEPYNESLCDFYRQYGFTEFRDTENKLFMEKIL
jgi:hypothetical protein